MSTPYGPDTPEQVVPPAEQPPPAPAQPPASLEQPPPGLVWQPLPHGQSWPAPFPTQPWPAVPPPPPKRRGRVAAIVLGITVPLLAVCCGSAVLVAPRVLEALPEP